ncbi:hypothetical protein [Kitasatospora sp. NPDC001095]
MDNSVTSDDEGVLVAVRSIRAARSRADVPSDNTGGKSDQNDT